MMPQDPFDAVWDEAEGPDEPEEPAAPAYTIPMDAAPVLGHSSSGGFVEGPLADRPGETVKSFGRGAGTAGIGAVQGAATAKSGIEKLNHWILGRFLGKEYREGVASLPKSQAEKTADALEKTKTLLPQRSTDPREAGFLTQDVPEAFGSAAAFMAGGLLSGGSGWGIAATGALSGLADGYYDAQAHNASEIE